MNHPFQLLTVLLLTTTVLSETILTSPPLTNWGSWYDWDNCTDDDTYVVGMRLKVEAPQGMFSDDTAVNGVRFYCRNINTFNGTWSKVVESKSDVWGSWGNDIICHSGRIATGFQMRTQPSQSILDDSAANNLRLFCGNDRNFPLPGNGHDSGTWTEAQHCENKQALCGLATQVETNHGSGDETALNGIKMKCCDVPDPATVCVPTDTWDQVIECNNRESSTPLHCSYERKVGTSNTTSFSENHWDLVQKYTDMGFSLSSALSFLGANFRYNVGESSETGYNWTRSGTEVWSEEITTTVGFEVPGGGWSRLFQVFGECGLYGAKTNSYKKVDVDEMGMTVVTYFEA